MVDNPTPTRPPVLERLHTYLCEERDEDFRRMDEILAREPEALNRKSLIQIFDEDDMDDLYLTPLLIAIECEHFHCTKYLLDKGADTNPEGTNGYDAMSEAIGVESYNIIELLFERGFGFDRTVRFPGKYVGQAASQKPPEMLQYILDHGGETETLQEIFTAEDSNCITPAVVAIRWERPDNLKVLLLNGAIIDPDKSNLMVEDERHDSLLLSLLLVISFGEDLDKKLEILQILYDFGVNFLRNTRMGPNPLRILECDILREEARLFVNLLDLRQFGKPDLSTGKRRKLAEKMRYLTLEPMSLKGQCRLVIKDSLGKKFYERVKRLPDLPRELIDYLQFKF